MLGARSRRQTLTTRVPSHRPLRQITLQEVEGVARPPLQSSRRPHHQPGSSAGRRTSRDDGSTPAVAATITTNPNHAPPHSNTRPDAKADVSLKLHTFVLNLAFKVF